MTSPQEPSSGWAAPGGSGDEHPGGAPAQPETPGTPPAPPTAWQPQGAPVPPRPDEPVGWAAPPSPPAAPAGWGQPPAPPAGWGAPPVPPAWTGPPPTTPAAPPAAWGTPQVPPDWTRQPPAAPATAPGYGPGYGPGPAVPPGYPAAPPVWAPPALQPGIVPLRPLSLGEILDGGVRAIRANPSVMFGLSAAAVTVAVLISALLTYYLSNVLAGTVSDFTGSLSTNLSPAETGQVSDSVSLAFGSVFTRPITSLVTTILTGLLVVSVSRSVLGRTISVREVLRSGRVWWVVGFSLLSGVAVVLAAALWVGVVLLLALGLHWEGAAVVVAVVGLIAFAVGAIWFSTRTLLVTPALMLEGKGFWATVARAWRLTRGSFWRLFGIWLLVSVIMYILAEIVGAPFAIIATLVGHGELTSVATLAITSIGEVVALTAATTYTSAVVALLYIDVRMRREGLDIELSRAATADAAAATR